MRPSRRSEADDPVETGLGDPELLHEHGGLVGLEFAELHLDPGGQRVDEGVTVVVGGGDPLDERRAGGDLALADVQEHEDGLLGQEAEATDCLPVVEVEAQVADRPAGVEARLEPPEDDLLALVRLALGGGAVAARRAEPLEAPVDQPGRRGELEVELLRSRAASTDPDTWGTAGSSKARTTWMSASASRSRARCSGGSSSVPTRPSDDGGGAGRST
jgi:hypothetical protein